jgi:hypothetical protein
MAYPYNPKIAPAIGNGLGGFPQKTAAVSSSTAAVVSTVGADKKFRIGNLSSYTFDGGGSSSFSVYNNHTFITNNAFYFRGGNSNNYWYRATFDATEVTNVSGVGGIIMDPTAKISDGVYAGVSYISANTQLFAYKYLIDDTTFNKTQVFAISNTGTTANTSESYSLLMYVPVDFGNNNTAVSDTNNNAAPLLNWFDGKFILFQKATIAGATKAVGIIINSTFTAVEGVYKIPDGSVFSQFDQTYTRGIKLVFDYGTPFGVLNTWNGNSLAQMQTFNFNSAFITTNSSTPISIYSGTLNGQAYFNVYPIGDGSKYYFIGMSAYDSNYGSSYLYTYLLSHTNGVVSSTVDTSKQTTETTALNITSSKYWQFIGDSTGGYLDFGKDYTSPSSLTTTLTAGKYYYTSSSGLLRLTFGTQLVVETDESVSYRNLYIEAASNVWTPTQSGTTSGDYYTIAMPSSFNSNGIAILPLYDDYNGRRYLKFLHIYKN